MRAKDLIWLLTLWLGKALEKSKGQMLAYSGHLPLVLSFSIKILPISVWNEQIANANIF